MKLKILCLHGFGQTPEMFRAKSGAFRQVLKKKCDFVFVQAPHVIHTEGDAGQTSVELHEVESDGSSVVAKDQRSGFAWWTVDGRTRLSDDWDPLAPPVEGQHIVGLEDSIRLIDATFRKEGPFDGCFAFSQGASFLSVITAIAERNRQTDSPHGIDTRTSRDDTERSRFRIPADLGLNIRFKFGIFVSGFFPREIAIREYIKYHMQAKEDPIKTIHVYGTTDKIIPVSMSMDYYDFLFSTYNPQETVSVSHEGGHFVPFERSIKSAVVAALQCFFQ